MLKVAALIALVIAAPASQVQAQAASSQSPDSAKAAQSKPIVVTQSRKICRTEIPTGSMLSKRVCRTEAEILQQRADGQALIEDLVREHVNLETQRANQGR